MAALSTRFGTKGHEDPWGDLKNLMQEGMLSNYVEVCS